MPLVLYAIGAVPVALRAFVPETVLDLGLAVLATGIGWLAIWLFTRLPPHRALDHDHPTAGARAQHRLDHPPAKHRPHPSDCGTRHRSRTLRDREPASPPGDAPTRPLQPHPTSQEETSMSTVTPTVPSAAPTAADPACPQPG